MSVAAPSTEESEAEALRRAQRAHEPSMEEILASIRAIIADDRDAPPTAKAGPQIVYSSDAPGPVRPSPPPEPAEPAAATVVWARPSPPARSEPEPAAPTVVWSRPAEVVPAAPAAEPKPAPAPAPAAPQILEDEEPLLSEEAGGAVAASFEALSASLASHGLEVAERLTREMLKPLIKSWLDENLPGMVERLVRAEIARLARGGR